MSGLAPELQIRGRLATITLRRPEVANRLARADLDVLLEQLAQVQARPEVSVLVLRSEGRHFCSGFNIAEVAQPAPEGLLSAPAHFGLVADAIEAARPVTLAVIQGGVYGGATDLALACDVRVGTTACEMFVPAAQLGLHFYGSGLRRAVQRLGLPMAQRIFLLAQRLDASQMRAAGLLTEVSEPEGLEAAAQALTERLLSMAPQALVGMKAALAALARGEDQAASWQAALDRSLASADLQEGVAAWLERRPPRFTGR